MHDDDLRSALLELTDSRPEPADPAAGVSRRVRRIRHRRRGTAAVLAAVVVTAVALAAVPALDALRSGEEPGVSEAGPTTTPTRRPRAPAKLTMTPTMNDPRKNTKLPPPWKDTEFTQFPERNLYGPQGISFVKGTLNGKSWTAITHTADRLSEGCVSVESQLSEFGVDKCFDEWPAGRRADWQSASVLANRKPDPTLLNYTVVGGAVSADARSVRITTASGKQYNVPAIGTPTSDKLRFFFTVLPERNIRVIHVKPLDGAGALAKPPVGLPPTGGPCYRGPREGHPNGIEICQSLSRPGG